jgi:hypothetical protein
MRKQGLGGRGWGCDVRLWEAGRDANVVDGRARRRRLEDERALRVRTGDCDAMAT